MKFFNFALICFIVIATLFINENIFCKKTINKSQKTPKNNQKNKIYYRLLNNKSVIITKHKNMILYIIIGFFSKLDKIPT